MTRIAVQHDTTCIPYTCLFKADFRPTQGHDLAIHVILIDQMGKNMSQEGKSKGWRNGSMDFDGLYDAYMVVA